MFPISLHSKKTVCFYQEFPHFAALQKDIVLLSIVPSFRCAQFGMTTLTLRDRVVVAAVLPPIQPPPLIYNMSCRTK